MSEDQLRGYPAEVVRRSREIGITPKRIQTFVQVLVETREPEQGHARAVGGLAISANNQPFIRSMLDGSPIAQLFREESAPVEASSRDGHRKQRPTTAAPPKKAAKKAARKKPTTKGK